MNSPSSFRPIVPLRQGFVGHPLLHERYGLPPEAAQQRRMVGEVGLEPTKASASGFTVRPLCHSGHSPKMDMRRLAPSACLLQPVMNFVLSFGMAPARAHNRLGTGARLIPNFGLICQLVNGFLPPSGIAAQ
jgi:hypothetical protein